MQTNKKKILWITDCHIKIFGRYKLLNVISHNDPDVVFCTGDLSEGLTYLSDLEFLGKKVGRPFYFVKGNHEVFFSSFGKVENGIRNLCSIYPNLIYLSDQEAIPLNEETAIIGDDSYFDARLGNENYLRFTFDWFLIEDFRKLPTMKDRIIAMRARADQSTDKLIGKLERAIDQYKTIYMLTHIPPWREAHRPNGLIDDKFYEPYNTNIRLGQELERVMEKHKKRQLILLSGHSHCPVSIRVSRNVECRVGAGSYSKISDKEIIYI